MRQGDAGARSELQLAPDATAKGAYAPNNRIARPKRSH
jgi:hypothetical protein